MLFKKCLKDHFKKFNLFILAAIATIGLYHCLGLASNPESNPATVKKTMIIGILMPMDHVALRDIVAGFKESVHDELKKMNKLNNNKINSDKLTNQVNADDVKIIVQNAQGDMNIQRSILQQFVRQNVDLIVPIGTTATQMTATVAKDKSILSLAANVEEGQRLKEKIKNITGVVDEIGPEKPLEFLLKAKPGIKKVTLLYSSSEKVFPEVALAETIASKKGIKLQKLMIQALPELYTISRLIDKESEAIFILKDHMIVSGIKTLTQEALKRKIPVVSSDEGSVKEGAAFALGIPEKEIGVAGGVIAAQILSGTEASNLPIKILDNLTIFYNPSACQSQNVDINQLKSSALVHGYKIMISENIASENSNGNL